MSLPAVTARLYSSDEVQYFSYLRSLYFDHDVSFENEYRYFHDHGIAQSAGFHETFLERETAAGRRVNYGTLGSAILWAPFYAVADVWTRATAPAAEANGYTAPYVRAVAYGSALYGFLAVVLGVRATRHSANTRHRGNTEETLGAGSILGGIAVWVGTPLLFYMYVAPPFSHACSAFAVAVLVNVWLHVRQRWTMGGAFAVGLCVALVAMVREQDAFLALGPLVDFGFAAASSMRSPGVRRGTAWVAAAVAGAFGTALGYLPQLFAYNALNGYPGPAEHVSRKMSWYAPHALQVLASPGHGFFVWTPLAVLAIAGLFFMKDRMIAAALLIMVASQVYVAGSVESWTVAGAFGQRRFVCLTVVLIIGIDAFRRAVASRDRKGAGRSPTLVYAAGAVIALCAWWNVALMAQFATKLMDRQRLEPARNAYHAFVTLPLEGPSLAWRYLTDRGSFYDAGPGGRKP